ncbi:MAG: hypothetical protein LBG47_05110 [Prevotellaceae bacterium]|jgi:hypothetical protein|nr:hypothetical protein [Prevotellaceae bacterium]
MRKLTRKNLDDLAATMQVMSEDEQRRYVGGADNTYYLNSDGTYYVIGSDGTIYGSIPEVTVAYVRGGTYYGSSEDFYQNRIRSNTLDYALTMVSEFLLGGGSLQAIYRANNENLYEFIKRNTDSSTPFWLRSEYGQSVVYNSSGEVLFRY